MPTEPLPDLLDRLFLVLEELNQAQQKVNALAGEEKMLTAVIARTVRNHLGITDTLERFSFTVRGDEYYWIANTIRKRKEVAAVDGLTVEYG